MNNKKIVEAKKLFIKKNFEETILLIENIFTDTEKTPEILNILGAAKLQKKNSNSFDMLSATENFRACYLMEKRTKLICQELNF